ncbi:ShlB/FhaC/HecB family hemolysin secretion/activation protein [Campylobacter sp. faydin G-140]|uniref:ShlB/FhaC/HecB family hemolysin secretion/activation protein n=1 Tax=Campylobacter anatolicus TaxID=2829105 RepID=UPI001B8FE865|nr:ShlB/FhaC/HecB family hemolysin secretion/activation protein [Campylobacter anatolicus]MBR8465355.1 ShlB/FhaC/HecB family hemolysin secretion/activation protein [Campylobacter anatolicus]
MNKIFILFLLFTCLFSQDDINQREFKNEQERIKHLQDSIPKSNINLQSKNSSETLSIIHETPCFEIDSIVLDDKIETKFQSYLLDALNKVGFQAGSCLGERSINTIISSINNEIISNGFITSFVSIKPLNLKSKKIELSLNLGKIDKISINNKLNQREKAMLFSAFGELEHNKTLNIRNIEQALENISNATLGDVGVSLAPANTLNSTDVLITRDQRALPLMFNINLDNYGSKETGKYQGTIGASAVNLLGFNEIYTISLGKAIFNTEKTSLNHDSQKGNSHNHYLNFSIPFGYFDLSYTNSRYSYSQIILGANQLYEYKGNSKSQILELSYLLHRSQNTKNIAFINLFRRDSKNYIEEFELKNQRRVTAGYEIGIKSQLNLTNSQLNTQISYKRGTGILGALPAPEEQLSEGSSRMKIWLLDVGYKVKLADNIIYDAMLYAQYNKTPLTIQDRLSVGGIYSVRGFDGQMSLVGQKGLYLRNTLAYKYINNHFIYLALDGGAVYSTTSEYSGSNKIAGTGLGIKGDFTLLGQTLKYDLLASTPIYKPQYFKTDKVNISFRVGFSW